jgi:hypothetical protein
MDNVRWPPLKKEHKKAGLGKQRCAHEADYLLPFKDVPASSTRGPHVAKCPATQKCKPRQPTTAPLAARFVVTKTNEPIVFQINKSLPRERRIECSDDRHVPRLECHLHSCIGIRFSTFRLVPTQRHLMHPANSKTGRAS